MKDRNIIEKFRVWDNSDDILEVVDNIHKKLIKNIFILINKIKQ